jgi:hypothetical protein
VTLLAAAAAAVTASPSAAVLQVLGLRAWAQQPGCQAGQGLEQQLRHHPQKSSAAAAAAAVEASAGDPSA